MDHAASSPALPLPAAGTITFLFTDIEGSTRLWEEHPEAMKAALARHDAILRHAIEASGGSVFKTVGDAFCAVFDAVPEAVAAALAAQRALAAEAWGETGSLRVRMAIHVGVVEARDGDYFGPPVNRVARLLDAGHGGQILLSQASQALAQAHLPPGASLRDLGPRRLRDLGAPERVFQLVVPDLPADFPRLKTLDARITNLPAQATSLVGREQEVAAVCALLRESEVRLVTLTGPGGTGKSRLALQVAANLLDAFTDGVFFVALAPIGTPALVAPAIAEALGIKEGADQPLAETLKNFLRDKHLLLLLDNFEQVVVASSLIAALLEAAPRLKVLVTSREILRLYGEHVFPVPPLAAPPPGLLAEGAQLGRELELLSQYAAVELFIQRAAAVKPGFSVTRENAPAVAEICARLDGLPLAIELAAARIKLFSPQALLARLDNSLTWLTGGARDLPARQQTLRAAIEWSYNLLSPDEQLIFRRVAVFAGGFTIEAAEQVAGYRLQVAGSPSDQPSIFNLQPSTFDALVSLVDKSLIQQEDDEAGEPRFTMLQTIREYALERLEASGEAAESWARHGRFFLALAEAAEPWLTSGERAVWLERLEVEHDNLRAALHRAVESGEVGLGLELAAALWWFWYFRGYYSEGRELLEAALALAEAAGESVVRAKALYAAAGLAWAQGDYGRARVLATQSVAEFGELGPAEGQAWALGILGIALLWQHDHAAARSVLEDSLKLFEKAGQTWGRAFTLFWTAMAAAMLRDETAARELLEQSLGLFRRTGDRWGISLALQALASGAMQAGDFATARALLEESLAGFRETGDNRLIAAMLEPLGHMAYAEGDIDRAAELFAEGLRLHRELGNKHGIAEALRDLGDVAREQGDPRRAEALYKESLALLWDIHERAGIAACLESIGGLLVAQGDCRRAATLLGVAEALRDATEMPLPPGARASYDRTLAALRACLDGDELAAAWAEGRAMPPDRAIALATGER